MTSRGFRRCGSFAIVLVDVSSGSGLGIGCDEWRALDWTILGEGSKVVLFIG